jgi:hypothetical protein
MDLIDNGKSDVGVIHSLPLDEAFNWPE